MARGRKKIYKYYSKNNIFNKQQRDFIYLFPKKIEKKYIKSENTCGKYEKFFENFLSLHTEFTNLGLIEQQNGSNNVLEFARFRRGEPRRPKIYGRCHSGTL